jgi:flagellar biosynthesis chaperone FliJ
VNGQDIRCRLRLKQSLSLHENIYVSVDPKDPAQAVAAFEENAEELVTYQLDLLAHLERQLRAAHHLMRNIEKLRNVKNRRVGKELSNIERVDTLSHLDAELDELDTHVRTQRQLCSDMHQTINRCKGRWDSSVRSRAGPRLPAMTP